MDPCNVSTLSSLGVNFRTSVSWSQPVALIQETGASSVLEQGAKLPTSRHMLFLLLVATAWSRGQRVWVQVLISLTAEGPSASPHLSEPSHLHLKRGGSDNNATLLVSLFN